MSIQCKLCQQVFSKLITSTHLKKHNTTTGDYRQRFGDDSIASPEYRKQRSMNSVGCKNPNFNNKWSEDQKNTMSAQKSGSTPWNKGKKYSATVNQLTAIENREQKYRTGELERIKHTPTTEERLHLSKKQIEFAKNNPEEVKLRAVKAVNTKREKGYDFGSNMRGKKQTSEALNKMAIARKKANITKSMLSIEAFTKNLEKCNVTLLNTVSEDIFNISCNVCNTHMSYTKQYFTNSKLNTEMCPKCYPKVHNRSEKEIQLFSFVSSLCPDAVNNCRYLIPRIEFDIYIPSANVVIEFNGLYWHSENVLESSGKVKTSDNNKRIAALENKLRYVGIFEDEWDNHREIVESRLRTILNKAGIKVAARKCIVKELDSKTASKFCKDNHIQGVGRSNIRFGLLHNDELVSVMTFSKNNLSRKISNWEINRFCNKLDMVVVGGASRLFKAFISKINPEKVISYADSRWSLGNMYEKIGFELEKEVAPGYWYFRPNESKRIHRFALRKTKNDTAFKTEKELRIREGYGRIWDCGNSKWVWTQKNKGQ